MQCVVGKRPSGYEGDTVIERTWEQGGGVRSVPERHPHEHATVCGRQLCTITEGVDELVAKGASTVVVTPLAKTGKGNPSRRRT